MFFFLLANVEGYLLKGEELDATPLGRGPGRHRRTGEFLPGRRRASNEDYPRSATGGARRSAC